MRHEDRLYRLRLPLQGVAGKVLQPVSVAVPPPVREGTHGANEFDRALQTAS